MAGNRTCTPVGPSACANGFEPATSGWGCQAVLPTDDCFPGDLVELGSRVCVRRATCTQPPDRTAPDTVVVDPTSPGGFATIELAYDSVPAGGTIVIAPGRYDETLTIRDKPVTLVGECGDDEAVLTSLDVSGAIRVAVKRVTLSGGIIGIRASMKAHVEIEDVQVIGQSVAGVMAVGPDTRVRIERSVIRDNGYSLQPAPAAIAVRDRATIAVIDVLVTDSAGVGIAVESVSTATLSGTVVRRIGIGSHPDQLGAALYVDSGSQVSVDRCVFSDNQAYGIHISGAATRVVIGHTELNRNNTRAAVGAGIHVQRGASFELSTSTIHGNRGYGVFVAAHSGTTSATISESALASTRGGVGRGVGLFLGAGSRVRVEKTTITAHEFGGVFALGDAASFSHSLISDTTRDAAGEGGYGLIGGDGGEVSFRASAVSGNQGGGLFIGDAGSRLTLVDTIVQDNVPRGADRRAGPGVGVLGAVFSMDGSVLVGHESASVNAVGSAAELHIRRSMVLGTHANTFDGTFGDGVIAQQGAVATIIDTQIADNEHFGVSVAGSKVVLDNCLIRHSLLGVSFDTTADVTLVDSIVAENDQANCSGCEVEVPTLFIPVRE